MKPSENFEKFKFCEDSNFSGYKFWVLDLQGIDLLLFGDMIFGRATTKGDLVVNLNGDISNPNYIKVGHWNMLDWSIELRVQNIGIFFVIKDGGPYSRVYEAVAENGLEQLAIDAFKNAPNPFNS